MAIRTGGSWLLLIIAVAFFDRCIQYARDYFEQLKSSQALFRLL